jgi:MFS family permease
MIWKNLTSDGKLLFVTRAARLFAYGFLSVVLVLYLAEMGYKEAQIGLLLTLTLLGDTAVSLWITVSADRIGRKRMLLVGAGLMILAGVVFALTQNYLLLVVAAIIGVISPSGNEVGPFLSIEQAALSQATPDDRRTSVFAWYNLIGSFATALGALSGGGLSQLLQNSGMPNLDSYRMVVLGYALLGGVLALLFTRLSEVVEVPPATLNDQTLARRFGLHKSQKIVLGLAGLFSLDAFAGGFVVQSFMAYWFHQRFGVDPAVLGSIFFGANLLAGISALLAAGIAKRIGLIKTMVFTHLPSNVLLFLVPFMPSLPLAIAVLLARFSISQMDVPTRQSYVMAVVAPDERSAASGITGIARTTGAAIAPLFAGILLASPILAGGLPFVISGGLKVIYDLLLWRSFNAHKPPEERGIS